MLTCVVFFVCVYVRVDFASARLFQVCDGFLVGLDEYVSSNIIM